MDELTIVHANELVEASYALSMNEMRVIALACTKFNSKKDAPDSVGEIRIDVNEFRSTYGIDNKNIYSELRDAVRSIMRKPVKMYNAETDMVEEYAWLTKNAYSRVDGSHILMRFSPGIEPYLFELKERFTRIDFKYAARLNTPFSFRLYQWLKKYEHLNKNKESDTVSVVLELEWMKKQAQLLGLYKRWGDFKDKVIQPAIDKINSETDLSVIFEPIRQGRSIYAVKFNYVVEAAAFTKPVRPRLKRRPKVVKGSHEEGVWMRKNLSLLLGYEKDLKQYDGKAKLDIKDVERIVEYSAICDHVTYERAKIELLARKKKAA